jgi:hypothetical protein
LKFHSLFYFPLVFAAKLLIVAWMVQLAAGSKGQRFKPGRGYGFLSTIKFISTASFEWKVKLEAPCCNVLRHIKITCKCELNACEEKFSLLSSISPTYSQLSLLVGLPESCVRRVRGFPQPESAPWSSIVIVTWEMNYRPVGGCGSET